MLVKKKIIKKLKNQQTKKKIKYKNNNNKSKKRKIAIIVALALLLVLAIIRVAVFFTKFQHTKIDKSDLGINKEIFTNELKDIMNIALLGVDSNGVSDAIIIASINPTANQPVIKLVSIARDTLVKVYAKNKEPYYTKINEAYGAGGEETTLRTLNKNFNLNIDNFISVEMVGFAKILDKLGGIELEITRSEKDQINGIINTTKSLKKLTNSYVKNHGKVHLNGAQTVAFARIRKKPTKDGNNDDFGRGDRQREVISKIFEKIKKTPKSKIFSLIEPSLEYIKTSFTLREIIKIAKDTVGRKYSIFQFGVPCAKMNVNRSFILYKNNNKKSTVLYDVKYAGKMINSFIYRNTSPTKFIEKNTQKSLSSLDVPKHNYSNNYKKQSDYLKKQPNINKNRYDNYDYNNSNIEYFNKEKNNNNNKQNSTKQQNNYFEYDDFNKTYIPEKQKNKQQKLPIKVYNNSNNNNISNEKNKKEKPNISKNYNINGKQNNNQNNNQNNKQNSKLYENSKSKNSKSRKKY